MIGKRFIEKFDKRIHQFGGGDGVSIKRWMQKETLNKNTQIKWVMLDTKKTYPESVPSSWNSLWWLGLTH